MENKTLSPINTFPFFKRPEKTKRKEMQTAYLELDMNGNVICANNVLLNMLSKEAEQLVGQHLNSILPQLSANPRIYYYVWKAILNGIIKKTDFVLLSDQEEHLIRFDISIDKNEDDEILRIIMISNNIAPVIKQKPYAYKSAQQALDDEERRLLRTFS